MAVCNLFKPINNKTGNFLLFSQYANDLTKSATHTDPYRVIPSKFIALNLDFSKFDNKSISKLFQNYFENACAYFKNNEFKFTVMDDAQIENWSPEIAKNIFWRCLYENNIITSEEISIEDKTYDYCPQMYYCGDINIQTNNIYSGEGYNEIYCYIPSMNNCQYIGCKVLADDEIDTKYEYNGETVIGYDINDEMTEDFKEMITVDNRPLTYKPQPKIYFSFEGNLNSDVRNISKYEFNTIIVLYDVWVIGENGIDWINEYSNIPLGIHFCGCIEDGVLTNPNTIFVSNDDIFGSGTSYGLKICSRYTATTDSNVGNIYISSGTDLEYPGFCIVMSEMAKTLDKMNECITDLYKSSQISKDVLAIFKNDRTNVPYVKYVGIGEKREPYWFVNGRNTGALATRVADHTNYDNETEVKPELERLEDLIALEEQEEQKKEP